MSGSEEVDPTRLMSLEAVQLLREVDEDTREGTKSKRLRCFGFGLTPMIVSKLATQQDIGGSQGINGKFECRLCCELLCILSWLQPYKKSQSWFQEKICYFLKTA